MRRATRFATILAIPLLAAACGPGNKQGTGTIVGATAGAVAGAAIGGPNNRVGGAVLGAAAGGLLGNLIGRDLDERDRQLAEAAQYQALEYGHSGQPTPWNNPDNQHRGQIVPGKPYVQNGLNCRTYTHTIYISGEPQTARGTACRQPDGTWKTVG